MLNEEDEQTWLNQSRTRGNRGRCRSGERRSKNGAAEERRRRRRGREGRKEGEWVSM